MKKPGIGLMLAVGKAAPPRYKATPDEPTESPRPAPSEKGGGPPKDPDAGRPEQGVTISPQAVCYHDSSEVCSGCEYFEGEQCRVLKMAVDPNGHCNAFEAKAGDAAMPESDEAQATPERPDGIY
jgi:hypothetical protein